MSAPLPFPKKGECYHYSNGSTMKKVYKCLQVMTNDKGEPASAYFNQNMNVSVSRWPSVSKMFTLVDCNTPIPEGYTKEYLDGGRRKNKSRRNKRKNRKTRRH